MDVKLPRLGEGAESGVVVNVFVKEGDAVAKDQAILELENEKAVASIPAPAAGTVTAVFVKAGDKVGVGQRLIALGDAGAAPAPARSAAARAAAAPPTRAQTAAAEPELAPEPEPELPPDQGEPAAEAAPSGQPPAASPTIRRLAKDLGIDLARVRGSERGGRIVMGDLRAYIQRLQRLATQASAAGTRRPKPAAEPVDFSKWGRSP